jgi:hypothetical protein
MMFPVDLVLRRQKPLFLICFDAGVAKFWLIIILLTHLVRPSKTELSSKAVARSDQASMSKHSSPIETHSHRFSFSFHEFLYFSGLQTYMYDNHRLSKKAATPSRHPVRKKKTRVCCVDTITQEHRRRCLFELYADLILLSGILDFCFLKI